MIVLEKIEDRQSINNSELHERIRQSSKSQHTKHFVAVEQNNDLGFVSLDLWPEKEFVVIYELFVPIRLRGGGIGRRIIIAIERFAVEQGRHYIRLNPEPFEDQSIKTRLIAWYKSQGFKNAQDGTGELVKCLDEGP